MFCRRQLYWAVTLVLTLGGCAESSRSGDGGNKDSHSTDLSRRDLTTADAKAGDSAPGGDSAGQDAAGPVPAGWLYTKGNHIYTSDGALWHGRGANIHDTRSCNACTWNAPDPGEVTRRIDELVDVWGATFIRLVLESYGSADGRVHWKPATEDSTYLQHIKQIVAHVGTKPGVRVLLSFWQDPTFSDKGWPTAATNKAWELFATTFANDAHVLFGLCNEPEDNWNGSLDAQVWDAMNESVKTIRAVEQKLGTPKHIIAVQGTGGWARRLDYYVSKPIAAGGGENIVYEVHPYNPTKDFQSIFIDPSAKLPVIIGEFGPFSGVDNQDLINLMDKAEALDIPYMAWTFHMRCPPNLIVDPGVGCGNNMTLTPTDWGKLLKNRLSQPW